MAALERIIRLQRDGEIDRSLGWEHYRAMIGTPDNRLRTHTHATHRMTVLDDETDDFDWPEDYHRWVKRGWGD